MSSQIAGENLLPNGGFENFTADWQAMGPGSFSQQISVRGMEIIPDVRPIEQRSGMVSELQIL